MSLTFPRAFPTLCGRVTGQTRPFYQQSHSMTGGAQPNVAEVADQLWRTPYTFEVRGRAEVEAFKAWLRSLRGGLRTFKGIPVRGNKLYRWPVSRPRGFDGLLVSAVQWDGTGNLDAIGEELDTITITELPNGLVLSPGDFISFPIGSREHLHQITEGGTVSAGSVTLTIEPTVQPDAVEDVAVRFEYPYCDMLIVSETDEPQEDRDLARFSFEGLQVRI